MIVNDSLFTIMLYIWVCWQEGKLLVERQSFKRSLNILM